MGNPVAAGGGSVGLRQVPDTPGTTQDSRHVAFPRSSPFRSRLRSFHWPASPPNRGAVQPGMLPGSCCGSCSSHLCRRRGGAYKCVHEYFRTRQRIASAPIGKDESLHLCLTRYAPRTPFRRDFRTERQLRGHSPLVGSRVRYLHCKSRRRSGGTNSRYTGPAGTKESQRQLHAPPAVPNEIGRRERPAYR